MVRRITESIGIFLALFAAALPALADTDAILAELSSQCYDVYKPQYDEARANLPMVASQDINLDELELPENLQQQLGFSSADLEGFADIIESANEFMAPYAQQAYLDLAQINVDLTNCYVEHTSSDNTLLANAEQLRTEAQDVYDTIAAYDFLQAFNSAPTGSATVTVPAHTTKTFRIRTYCLDGGQSAPEVGEEYILAGTMADLQDGSLCQTIQSAQDFSAITQAQQTIWTSDTALKPAVAAVSPSTTNTTTNESTNDPAVNESTAPTESVESAVSTSAITSNFSNPMAIGVTAIGGVITFASLLALLFHWGPKPLSVGGMLLGAGVVIAGVVWLVMKTALASEANQTSLFTAAQQQQVIVKAVSTGSFTSLDVTITNVTGEDLTLDTSCLRFIPTVVSFDDDLANSYDNYDVTWEDINSGEVDWEDMDESYDDTEYDEGQNSQRLGTGDVIDDTPPPLPPDPPKPDDTIDIEELKQKTKKALDEAKKKFEENPTEDNLKDVLKEAQKCQAIGCSEQDPMDGVADGWQKNVDQATKDYKNDPSDLNRERLVRSTEIGQMLGADTTAAVGALLGQ